MLLLGAGSLWDWSGCETVSDIWGYRKLAGVKICVWGLALEVRACGGMVARERGCRCVAKGAEPNR